MNTKKLISLLLVLVLSVSLFFVMAAPTFAADEMTAADTAAADETTTDNVSGTKALSAALLVGVAAAAGAIGMAIAIGKSTTSMARQPEAAGKINSAMMLGLVFIETAIIYALIVAILIIFVL